MFTLSVQARSSLFPIANKINSNRRHNNTVLNATTIKKSAGAEIDEDQDYALEAGIEPCLVGYVDKDSNGVEMYCCEQPDGTIECRTMTPEHTDCAIIDGPEGQKIDCNPKLKVSK